MPWKKTEGFANVFGGRVHNGDASLMFGVLAIDKPAGMTSRGVVNRVERLVKPHRVGHTGTLDPMATGVLLMAIGSATRLVEFSHLQSKSYEAEFLIGHVSDTLDTEGTVLVVPEANPISREQLESELPNWIGRVAQTPPKFSAVHIAGKRAYELARRGTDFEVGSRTVDIQTLSVLDFSHTHFTLRIDCGTGTYIRSLGSDIAKRLGSDAVMSRLVRTRVGSIELNDCVSLDVLQACTHVEHYLLPPNLLVASLPKVELDDEQAIQIRHGIPLTLSVAETGPIAAIDERNELVAIIQCHGNGNIYRSLRVFQKANATAQPSNSNSPHSPES